VGFRSCPPLNYFAPGVAPNVSAIPPNDGPKESGAELEQKWGEGRKCWERAKELGFNCAKPYPPWDTKLHTLGDELNSK
jgi:hypothetical protein